MFFDSDITSEEAFPFFITLIFSDNIPESSFSIAIIIISFAFVCAKSQEGVKTIKFSSLYLSCKISPVKILFFIGGVI